MDRLNPLSILFSCSYNLLRYLLPKYIYLRFNLHILRTSLVFVWNRHGWAKSDAVFI